MALDDGALDLRLGWLETFLSVAHHMNYQFAGDELGMPAERVQRRVERLEAWLRRPLIVPCDKGLALADFDGEEFLFLAIDVLNMFDAACAKTNHPSGWVPLKERSNLRLADLQAFLAVAACGSFKKAAADPEETTTVRRNVQAVEFVLGWKLLKGGSTASLEALDFLETARLIVRRLQDFRKPVPEGEDLLEETVRFIADRARKACRTLSSNISIWEGRKRLKTKARKDLKESRRQLELHRRVLEECDAFLGAPPSTSAAHIDMDAFFRESADREASLSDDVQPVGDGNSSSLFP